jgi:hypothetical protein
MGQDTARITVDGLVQNVLDIDETKRKRDLDPGQRSMNELDLLELDRTEKGSRLSAQMETQYPGEHWRSQNSFARHSLSGRAIGRCLQHKKAHPSG